MRPWIALSLLLLAGCAGPATVDETPEAPIEPVAAAPEVQVLVDQLVQWHEPDPNPVYAPLTALDIATQPVAHPCIFDGEPYFNNRQLTTSSRGAVEPAAGVLRVTLSWGPTDYVGDALIVAYKAPGASAFKVTDAITNGQTLDTPAQVEAPGDGGSRGWNLWLCIDTEAPEAPRAVLGSIQTRIEFVPDGA